METKLKAERRDETGKGVARKLRAAGRVPGVLYGGGADPVALSVSAQDLLHLFRAATGSNVLVELDVDGDKQLAIPREIQRDTLHAKYVHIDFLAVRHDETITVTVEIHEVGEAEAPGIREGGVVEHHLREVQVECLPNDVPEVIEADISALDLGAMLKVCDIAVPAGVTILTDADTPVISVITPAALRTEADLTVPGEEGEIPEGEAPAAEAVEGEAPAAEAASEEGGEG
jgi:large subunit ribosomal protein L25